MGEDYVPIETANKKEKYENILNEMQHRVDSNNHL